MTDIHKLFMVKINKMIERKQGRCSWSFNKCNFWQHCVYRYGKKTMSYLHPGMPASYHIWNFRLSLNCNAMFNATFICFLCQWSKTSLFQSLFINVWWCWTMLNIQLSKSLSRKWAIISLLFIFNLCFIKHCVII